MEFIYSNYTSSIDSSTIQIYSEVTNSLDIGSNAGILSRLDLVPQSGSLTLLEANTLLGLWGHTNHQFDFSNFVTRLNSGNYNSVDFHEEENPAQLYPFYNSLSSSLSTNDISSSLVLHESLTNPYITKETDTSTTYKLYNIFPSNTSLLHRATADKKIMRSTFSSNFFSPTSSLLSYSNQWSTSSDYPDLVIKKGDIDNSQGVFYFNYSELVNHDPDNWETYKDYNKTYAEKYIHSDQYKNFSVVIGSYGIVDESNVMTINNHSKLLYNYLNNPIQLGSSPFEELDSGVLTLGNVSSSWNRPDIELTAFSKLSGDTKVEKTDGSFVSISSLSVGDSVKCYTTDDTIKYLDTYVDTNFVANFSTSSQWITESSSSISDSSTLQTENVTILNILPMSLPDLVTIDSKIKISKWGSLFAKPNGESNYRMVDVNNLIQNNFAVLNSDGESVTINTSNITESDSDLTAYKLIFDGDSKHFEKRFLNVEGYLTMEC